MCLFLAAGTGVTVGVSLPVVLGEITIEACGQSRRSSIGGILDRNGLSS